MNTILNRSYNRRLKKGCLGFELFVLEVFLKVCLNDEIRDNDSHHLNDDNMLEH